MNFINSFNVQGEPCAMGNNKLVVPFIEADGVKVPVILLKILELMNGDGADAMYPKEEFLQFFGGALPETTGSYLLVENLEDSTGFSSKWTKNVLTEKLFELEMGLTAKVYTISIEDFSMMDINSSLAGGGVNELMLLSILGFLIIDTVNPDTGEETIILSTSLF